MSSADTPDIVDYRLGRDIKKLNAVFKDIDKILKPNQGDPEPTRDGAELRFNDATRKWDRIQKDFKIILAMFYPQFKDPDVKTKIESLEDARDNWEEMYEGYKFQLSRKFPPQGANQIHPIQQSSSTIKFAQVKMEFDGKVINFPRFWQLFKHNVHDRQDMDNVTKFTHLLQSTKGDALNLLQGYNVSEENYDVVIALLKREFGNENIIKDIHLVKLTNLLSKKPAITDSAFKELYLEATTHSRALEALKYDENALTATMSTLLVSRMPPDMQRLWYRKKDDNFSLKDLFEFIDGELAVYNPLKQLNGHSHQPDANKKSAEGRGTASALHAGKKGGGKGDKKPLPCLFCNKMEHPSGRCHKSRGQRKEIMK